MSASAKGEVLFGDAVYPVFLGIEHHRELQEKTGAGPYAVMRRIVAGDWRIDDLRETIRLGLIGGGMEAHRALVLTMRYVDARPKLEAVDPALKILDIALSGWTDEPKVAGGSEGNVTAERDQATTGASASAN